LDQAHPIKKWVPTVGLWDTSADNLVYMGPDEFTRQPYGQPLGLLLSDVWFIEGKIEVTVILPKADDGGVDVDACGGLLFGYRSENDEYRFVALGGWGSLCALGRFVPELGSWFGKPTIASVKNLRPQQTYILSVRVQGQSVTAEVDGSEVLTHRLDSPPLGRIGLYAWGTSQVEFRAASVTERAGQWSGGPRPMPKSAGSVQHVPVFVSSTYEDLIEYRTAVTDALHRLETIVRGMEYFGSKPQPPKAECLKALRSCKAYIGIFAMRYGSIDDETGKSMTHIEYDEAQRFGLPTLVYMIDEKHQPILPMYVDTGDKAQRLQDLKKEIKKQYQVSFFTTPEDLAKRIAQDLPSVLESIGVRLASESVMQEHKLTRLQCRFSSDISGCVRRNVILTHLPIIDNPTIPPYSTVATSRGSSVIQQQENIVLYSIKVEAIGQKEIRNCRGQLMTISRGDRVWDVDTILSFAPFEKRDESADKTIFPQVPAFLNVFFITEHNKVRICSYLNLPSNIWREGIFGENGVYIFEIAISAADCATEIRELKFNWTGDINVATVTDITSSA
jgi:hypothetical protein